MMTIHDISQPLAPDTAPWPGDAPFRQEWTLRRARGDSVDAAEIALSVHLGTHADGPAHAAEGPPIGAVPLAPYLGASIVVQAIGAAELGAALLDTVDLARTPRVLFRGRPHVDPRSFPEAFPAISPALARRLVEGGAVLVGTDAPSVDPADSRELESHGILAAGGVAILENLVLDDVAPGEYTLVALPLKLAAADSSPVRAVLLDPRDPEPGTRTAGDGPPGDAGTA